MTITRIIIILALIGLGTLIIGGLWAAAILSGRISRQEEMESEHEKENY